MRQLKKNRRRGYSRRGLDPAVKPKKKKYLLKFDTDLTFEAAHSTTTGLPTSDDSDGGIKRFTFKWNDCFHPIIGSTAQPDGFADISADFSTFQVIGGRAKFDFDMRECAPYKLYMVTHHNENLWASLEITPDFTSPANAETTRQLLLTYLDKTGDKTNMSSHWLQRGDGYNSIGTISLRYSPKKFDPSRGSVLDDDNLTYATRGNKYVTNLTTGTTAGAPAQPTDKDYCSILLVPTSSEYMAAYYAGAATSVISFLWGKFRMEQIVVAINSEASTRIRSDVSTNAEREGTGVGSASVPTPAI